MADVTLAEVLPLFTKVNTALVKRLEKLEKSAGPQYNKPSQVLEEPQPVVVESFGKAALAELNKSFKIKLEIPKQPPPQVPKKQSDTDIFGMIKNAAFIASIGLVVKKYLDGLFGDEKDPGSLKVTAQGLSMAASGLKGATKDLLDNSKALRDAASTVKDMGTSITESIAKGFQKGAVRASDKTLAEATTLTGKALATGERVAATAKGATEGVTKGARFGADQKIIQQIEKGGHYRVVGPNQIVDRAGRTLPKDTTNLIFNAARSEVGATKQPGWVGKAWQWTKTKAGEGFEYGKAGVEKSAEMLGALVSKIPGGTRVLKALGEYGPSVGRWGMKWLGKPLGFLLNVLGIPGVADTIITGAETHSLVNKFREGKISEHEFRNEMATTALRGIGSTTGGIGGSIAGWLLSVALSAGGEAASAGLFTPLIPLLIAGGPKIGQLIGTFAGDMTGWASGWVLKLLSSLPNVGPLGSIGEGARSTRDTIFSLLFKPYANITGHIGRSGEFLDQLRFENAENREKAERMKSSQPGNTIKTDDVTISAGGKIIQPHADDTLYAMKNGGPLDKYFNNNTRVTAENNKTLKNYAKVSTNLLNDQIKLMSQTNKLLLNLVETLSQPANILSQPTVVNNTFNSGVSLRGLQGALA